MQFCWYVMPDDAAAPARPIAIMSQNLLARTKIITEITKMLNHLTIQGNLVDNPTQKWFESGSFLSEFTIACNNKYKDKERTVYLECKLWSQSGQTFSEWFHKGDQVLIEGELQTESWTVSDDSNRSKIICNVNKWHFMSSPRSQPQSRVPQSQVTATQTPRQTASSVAVPAVPVGSIVGGASVDPSYDNIPF